MHFQKKVQQCERTQIPLVFTAGRDGRAAKCSRSTDADAGSDGY